MQFLARVWRASPLVIMRQPLDECRAEAEFGEALARANLHAAALEHFTAAEKLHPAEAMKAGLEQAKAASLRALRGTSTGKAS